MELASPKDLGSTIHFGTIHNIYSLKILALFILALFTDKHVISYNFIDHSIITLEQPTTIKNLMTTKMIRLNIFSP